MNKTQVITTIVLEDGNKNKLIGYTAYLCKAGTAFDFDFPGSAVLGEETAAGVYKFTIPNTYLANFYDLWVEDQDEATLTDINVSWQWKVSDIVPTDSTEILFADLTDDAGNTLPETIDNAVVMIIPKSDRSVYLVEINATDTGFTPGVSIAGADDPLVDIIIMVGEE